MADYKRLVSYIYNYEYNTKKNNVGYARVESNNGQCKVTVHINVLTNYEHGLSVYFFRRDRGRTECILLGTMQPRNGVGDFRIITRVDNLMDLGYSLDEMGGMLIWSSPDKYFGSEWDDIPIVMKEIITAEPRQEAYQLSAAELCDNEKPARRIYEEASKEPEPEEAALAAGLTVPLDEAADSGKQTESELEAAQTQLAQPAEEEAEEESAEPPGEDLLAAFKNAMQPPAGSMPADKAERGPEPEPVPEQSRGPEKMAEEEAAAAVPVVMEPVQEEPPAAEEDMHNSQKAEISDETKEEAERYFKSIARGRQGLEPERIMQIFTSYPKLYPFEDDEILECVRIEPQDIGIFPMEYWDLANNSFLLHGYYSYRHLIFARRRMGDGVQYVAGVPGIYYNREKFMAKMFGFEYFKSIKNKEQKTGEFGYWLRPIS